MITPDDLRLAQRRVRGVALRTPLVPCPRGEESRLLYFKAENLQPTGAFKLRGAYNKISSSPREPARGRGPFERQPRPGRGLRGTRSRHAGRNRHAAGRPRVKTDATAAFGAEILFVGDDSGERARRAEELAAEHGYVLVPPYDDETLIAGQGTVGLEILEDLPDVETVLVPVSGGGLISGVAAAIKQSRPGRACSGSNPNSLPTPGEPEEREARRAPRRTGRAHDRRRAARAQARARPLRARSRLRRRHHHRERGRDTGGDAPHGAPARLVAEPSGAVTFAGYLFHRDELPATRLNVAVVSGGNVEPQLLARIIAN